jgi:hypothetical protein
MNRQIYSTARMARDKKLYGQLGRILKTNGRTSRNRRKNLLNFAK